MVVVPVHAKTVLEGYKVKYNSSLMKIGEESTAKLRGLPIGYVRALKKVEAEYKAEGDLNALLALKNELKRFLKTAAMPEEAPADLPPRVVNLQESYKRQETGARFLRAERIVALTDSYKRVLERLQKKLTQTSGIKEALKVKKELDAIEENEDVKQARVTLAALAPPPEPERPEEPEERLPEGWGRNDNGPREKPEWGRKSKMGDVDKKILAFARKIRVVSAGRHAGNFAEIEIDGRRIMALGQGAGRGLNVVVVNREGEVMSEHFDTNDNEEEAKRFARGIDDLPKGMFVIIAVADDGAEAFNKDAQKAINSIGAKEGLKDKPIGGSYICVGATGLGKGKALEAFAREALSLEGGRIDRFMPHPEHGRPPDEQWHEPPPDDNRHTEPRQNPPEDDTRWRIEPPPPEDNNRRWRNPDDNEW